jgi:probable phosphoglycerate mutase
MNTLFLLRHGENRANLTKEFSYKKVDYPLNKKGVLQAQQTAEFLNQKQIDVIITSPLKRAVQTASIVGESLGLTPVVMENFREINVGALEEMPPSEENWGVFKKTVMAWANGDKDTAFPGGENFHQLWHRFQTGLKDIIHQHPEKRILVVGHGGIFTLTMGDLCPGVDVHQLIQSHNHNCALTEIQVRETRGKLTGELRQWSNTDHLSGEAARLVTGTPQKGALKS